MQRLTLAALALGVSACAQPDAGALGPVAQCAGQASQALRDVCVLSHDDFEGRLVGTAANARARAYLVSRFEETGLKPVGDDFVHAFDFERRVDFRDPDSPRETLTGYNIIGHIPGSDSSKALIVTAHYDHVGPGDNNEIFNGADDNASGVGAILAVAAHFKAHPPQHDVLIIAFDAEEGGLNGARAFVDAPPDGTPVIGANLNLDMLGYSPEGDIWVAGSHHTPGLLPVIEAVADNAAIQVEAGYDFPTGDPREDWTLLSDHGPFHVAGYPFLYLGVEDHEHYHQPSDEFSIIDPAFYNGVVDVSVELAVGMDRWLSQAHGDVAEAE